MISSEDKSIVFTVHDLKVRDDAILHIGEYSGHGQFENGSTVNLSIEKELRYANARVHSAGHLIDVAMNRAERKDLEPSKGYHFAQGSYVEYIGTVAADERSSLAEEL